MGSRSQQIASPGERVIPNRYSVHCRHSQRGCRTRLELATVSVRALSTVSASAYGEHEIANGRWASQLVMVPAAHARPSTRLPQPQPHESAAGSEAIPGTLLLATARFRSICTAGLKIVAAGEEREGEGS